jgi:hypothetical protein
LESAATNKQNNKGKIMKPLRIGLIAVVFTLITAGGCATRPKPLVKIDSPPKTVVYHETIVLDQEATADLGKIGVPEEDDAQQVIKFALTLSSAGRHVHAATFLEEAATKFSSRNNELAIACLAAAANEYLLAGDATAMPSFRNAVRRLSQMANRYQAASFDQNFLTLLCLGAIANGEVQPADKELTPKAIRELYPAFAPAGSVNR